MLGTSAAGFASSNWFWPLVFVAFAVTVFVLAAWFSRGPAQVRAAYFYGLAFVSLVAGLGGARGLFAALGEAVSDTPSGTTCGPGIFGTAAAQQETPTFPPIATPPPIQPPPTFEFPDPRPLPSIRPVPSIGPTPAIPSLPSFPGPDPDFEVPEEVLELIGCAPGSGRDRAAADAAFSGSLFVLAAGLGLVNLRGAQAMLNKETRHE